MGILMTIISMYITLKIIGLAFKIVGKLIGSILGLAMFLLIAVCAVKIIGLALIAVPIIIMAGSLGIAAKAAIV